VAKRSEESLSTSQPGVACNNQQTDECRLDCKLRTIEAEEIKNKLVCSKLNARMRENRNFHKINRSQFKSLKMKTEVTKRTRRRTKSEMSVNYVNLIDIH
jgi:hypothetical protein